jgi:hypothetical protein
LTSIAFSLHRLGKSKKFKEGGLVNSFTFTESVDYNPPKMEIHIFKHGDRVRATEKSGFHRGATGTVQFQKAGALDRCWVLRDGAGGPCWFYNYELEPINHKEPVE